MNLHGKRVFVTGGSGFIGSHLVERLQKEGAELLLFVHKKQPQITCDYLYGDLEKPNVGWLESYIRGFDPEIVFHLAAQPIVCEKRVNEIPTLNINITGTFNVLHACKNLENLKSFVHISTDKVYGNVSPITKDTVPNGTGHPYNTSKLAGDYLAQMYSNFYDIPMVIIRHANVYGAGDTHLDRIVPRTIQKVLRGESPIVRGDGSNTRDYLHVTDVVDGYLRCIELASNPKVLNLGGFNHSVIEVVDTILSKMSRIDIQPTFEKQWQGEIPHQHIVNDEAKSLIGWEPQVDLNLGLDRTIGWYRDEYGN